MDEEGLLVAQARAGSVEAFTRLVGIHQARVRSFLARYVDDHHIADDLAQEAFFSAYRTLQTYDPGDAPLGVWLIGIARNRALTYLRSTVRRRARESGAVEAALSGWKVHRLESETGSPAREDGRIAALEKCMGKLPEQSAAMVENYYFKGLRAAEIARGLGKREDMVRKALMRIRQALRHCVEHRLALEGR